MSENGSIESEDVIAFLNVLSPPQIFEVPFDLGMLPSASLGEVKDNGLYFGMYEPSGGSAPDIAGQGIANPIAQILSVSMMLRYSLGETIAADAIDTAAQNAIDLGLRTGDLFTEKNGETRVNTIEMGNAILKAL
ncbi:isocitrate/isopropylmalate family dehydrogenase [Akkermansiaceae bacterium]|nr:isocitrate/isopropylmalate family dehydrogenase [Akkermansiaceae bacterium]